MTIASRRDGGDEVLDISGLVPHDLHGVDLALPAGEIVGVTWLIGSRIAQPGSVVFGALPRTSGTVWAGEREVPPDSAAAAIAAGMGFVPADRRACGVLASLAGLLFTARLGTADLTTGPAYLAPKNVSASVRPLVEGGLLTRNLIPRTGVPSACSQRTGPLRTGQPSRRRGGGRSRWLSPASMRRNDRRYSGRWARCRPRLSSCSQREGGSPRTRPHDP